jgi:hypothetical protein
MAFDVSNGLLYTGDGGRVIRANLDGTSPVDIVTNTRVVDIELDVQNGKMYWSDTFQGFENNNRKILRAITATMSLDPARPPPSAETRYRMVRLFPGRQEAWIGRSVSISDPARA